MHSYYIPDTPEIFSFGIKAILLSLNEEAIFLSEYDLRIRNQSNQKNVVIHILFLTSDKKSLDEVKKYLVNNTEINKIIIVTQNNDIKFVPALKNVEFDALTSAEEVSKENLTEILNNISQNKMYINSFYIGEILKSKYDINNLHLSLLTSREFEIVNNMLLDKSNLEIADYFQISIRTVNAHKRNILKKFNAKNMEYVISIICQYGRLYQ